MTILNFSDFADQDWLDSIPEYYRVAIGDLLVSGKTEEEIAEMWLNRIGADATAGFGSGKFFSSYYSNFRKEIDEFICGDKKYAQERSQAEKIWEKQGKNGLVIFISGVIAAKIDLSAVALIPPVTLMFGLLGKIGLEAYCKTKHPK